VEIHRIIRNYAYTIVPASITMSTAVAPSLLTLPAEVSFAIFKRLDRPSKLSLGLTGPHFLHLLARYYDLDRYRDNENMCKKFDLPAGVSWDESAAQPTIIRWLAASGSDDIDDPLEAEEEEEYPAADENDIGFFDDPDEEQEGPLPYEDTEEARDDAIVETLISDWLRAKFNITGGCIICAECCRYMLVLGLDGKITPWSKNMLGRQA
jgi:hypothetical protein